MVVDRKTQNELIEYVLDMLVEVVIFTLVLIAARIRSFDNRGPLTRAFR